MRLCLRHRCREGRSWNGRWRRPTRWSCWSRLGDIKRRWLLQWAQEKCKFKWSAPFLGLKLICWKDRVTGDFGRTGWYSRWTSRYQTESRGWSSRATKDSIKFVSLPQGDKLSTDRRPLGEERRNLLKTLGKIDFRKWQDSNIRLRQPGTGVWFTDGAYFRTWLSTDESKLWVNGIRKFLKSSLRECLYWTLPVAGAGKTILM